jgi:DNA-directed RNA polymerase subunit RPC12/RpoP
MKVVVKRGPNMAAFLCCWCGTLFDHEKTPQVVCPCCGAKFRREK